MVLILAFLFVAGIVARVYLFFTGMRVGGRLAGGGAMSKRTNETHSLWGWSNRAKPEKKFDLAQSDSFGFFNAIPNDEWTQMKHETMMAVDLQHGVMHRTSDLISESGANINSNLWWKDNWEVSNDLHRCCTIPYSFLLLCTIFLMHSQINFANHDKVRIGGYWICDPLRIVALANEYRRNSKPKRRKKKDQPYTCVVYASGGNEIEFGEQYFDYLLSRQEEQRSVQVDDLLACEIHIFAPNMQVGLCYLCSHQRCFSGFVILQFAVRTYRRCTRHVMVYSYIIGVSARKTKETWDVHSKL